MEKIKQILLVFMSVCLLILSIYYSSFISYASNVIEIEPNHLLKAIYESADDRAARENAVSEFMDSVMSGGAFFASSLGAVVHGQDFTQFIKNYEAYKEYTLNGTLSDNVTVSDDYSISISADLMNVIKDALREYSEETNGFWIMPTTSTRALNPQHFEKYNAYTTLYNLISNHGIIACQMDANTGAYSYLGIIAADFSEYLDPSYSFVCRNGTGYNPYNATSAMVIELYDSSWSGVSGPIKYTFGDGIYNDVSDGSEFRYSARYSYFYVNYPKYHDGLFYRCPESNSTNLQNYGMLISKDGCRIRVFKSVNAMKVYDTGTRTVYFGSEFYEKEPTDITITIDDLDKYLNTDFDKYFGELKDTITSQGSNLSEQEIEKFTDSILGKLTDIDNSIGEVGGSVQESNNLLSQILAKLDNLDNNVSSILANLDNEISSTLDFSGIEERLDTIILSLGVISGQLDDMAVEEIEQKTDDMLKDMQLEFSDIGELAKTKFPLSLPWDLGKAFDKISGGDIASGESPPEAVAMLLYDEPDKFVHTMSLYNDNGIALYASEDTDSSQGGGYFPSMEFDVDSLRGTDSGGASKWGAWHSDSGAPIFYIPVEFSQSMKIGGVLIIDLSGFEVVHSIGRLMFSIIFCMNLVHLTFKAISAGKDLLTWSTS